MGTPNYTSPEQAMGNVEDIDERTDQWALACIAWECLSGQGPFLGENVPSILFHIVHEAPSSLLPKVAGLHPQVEQVLLRGLAKDKQGRFASVNDFAMAIEAAVGGNAGQAAVPRTVRLVETMVDSGFAGASAPGTTFSRTAGQLDNALDEPPPRSKAWIWAAAVGVFAILIVGAFLFFRSGALPKPVVATPPAAEVVEPEPQPLAAPPVVPAAPPSAQAEIKPEPPSPSPKPLSESKPRKSRHTVAPAPSGRPFDSQRAVPALPPPAEKPKKGNQDEWRLD